MPSAQMFLSSMMKLHRGTLNNSLIAIGDNRFGGQIGKAESAPHLGSSERPFDPGLYLFQGRLNQRKTEVRRAKFLGGHRKNWCCAMTQSMTSRRTSATPGHRCRGD